MCAGPAFFWTTLYIAGRSPVDFEEFSHLALSIALCCASSSAVTDSLHFIFFFAVETYEVSRVNLFNGTGCCARRSRAASGQLYSSPRRAALSSGRLSSRGLDRSTGLMPSRWSQVDAWKTAGAVDAVGRLLYQTGVGHFLREQSPPAIST